METWGWWTLAGLVADIVGTIVVVSAVLTSKERAFEAGIPRLAGDTDDENLKLSAVRNRLNQSRRAAIGVGRRATSPRVRPDDLERRLRARLDALGPAPRADILHVLRFPDFDRAERIGEFWGSGNPH